MIDKLLHTPEGVRDIYNSECERKTKLETELMEILGQYGFRNIQTPMFEFFDVYNKERGTVPAAEVYKFFDREGNILALRPDITPSIARCVAKYFKEETMPIRLSYCGNTFINNSSYQGKLKESTQLGAELVNDESVNADADMIALTVECLLKSGLKEFQVEIGQADFFKGLVKEANLDEDEIEQLRILIENKNMFGVEELIAAKQLPEALKQVFLELPELFGTIDKLITVKRAITNEASLKAIERLEQVYEILRLYGFEDYITFDLGMLSKYDYYTGIIFRAYTYGSGDAIANGGRYDTLVSQFGKEAPAIGMAILVDQLISVLVRQKLTKEVEITNTLLVYNKELTKTAIALAKQFRSNHMNIELLYEEEKTEIQTYLDYARRMHIGGILYLSEMDQVKIIDAAEGDVKVVTMDELLSR